MATIDPARLWGQHLEWAQLPPRWSAAVADAAGNIVARRPREPEDGGAPAPYAGAARNALQEGRPLGWARDNAADGRPLYVAWHRVDSAPWMVLVSLPSQMVDGALLRLLSPVLLVGGLMLLLFTGALAFWVDRRMAMPLERLGRMAASFGRGVALPPSRPPACARSTAPPPPWPAPPPSATRWRPSASPSTSGCRPCWRARMTACWCSTATAPSST
ncbi:PDC sensor domain-containing protein [Teichococcus aestuarii]|uniref:hypothetical protein n=1 Tax=Teichococcus aestuarii TaxID=568898 RepID=UPI003613ED12